MAPPHAYSKERERCSELGLFDPDLWIRWMWEKEGTGPAPPAAPPARKKLAGPVDRVKSEGVEGEIVLSPQRRSFGQGCRRDPGAPRCTSPNKATTPTPNEDTLTLLNHLFPDKKPGMVGKPVVGQKTIGHPAAVIGAARGRTNFQPSFAQQRQPEADHGPPEPFQKGRDEGGSWRSQMMGPDGVWRNRGNSGGGSDLRRYHEPQGARTRGGHNPHWNNGHQRQEVMPEWMDGDADVTMELGGFEEHEARKAREKETMNGAPPEYKGTSFPDRHHHQSPTPPGNNHPADKPLERESDFTDMFGISPSQMDAGVDVLFPFMAGNGSGFLSGSSVSVPGQAERVEELKSAGQSRFSRFFGAKGSGEAKDNADKAEERHQYQMAAQAESDRIMAKLMQGGPKGAALENLLSNSGPSPSSSMPPPPTRDALSLQDIEAKLREQNGMNGQRPIEGQPGRGLFGRAKEDDAGAQQPGWQPGQTKGNPLSDPASAAHLMHSLNKLSIESAQLSQAENGAQAQANALQQLLQQSRAQGVGFPPHAFGAGGRIVPPVSAPPVQPQPQVTPRPFMPPPPMGPVPAMGASGMEPSQAHQLLLAMAAKARATGQPPDQAAILLSQLMAQARSQAPPTGANPMGAPPRPHNVHMPPFVGSSQPRPGGPPNGAIPPPELYNMLAAQMHANQAQAHHQHHLQQHHQYHPTTSKPSASYGPGFMPLSVLKQAAGRKTETSVDAHLAAMGKSGSGPASDDEENFGTKRLSVANAGAPMRPFAPPVSAPVTSGPSFPTHQPQHHAFMGMHQPQGGGGVGGGLSQMGRAQQIQMLQAAAARGDEMAIRTLHALHQSIHQQRVMSEHQQQAAGSGEALARLFGANASGPRMPTGARPLSLEEVERQAAQAAASQPFV